MRGRSQVSGLHPLPTPPPLPFPPRFCTRHADRKALDIAFSRARYSGGPKLLIFQTEVPFLLNIVIYCGGYSGAFSRAKRTEKSIQEILVLRKLSARTSTPLMRAGVKFCISSTRAFRG